MCLPTRTNVAIMWTDEGRQIHRTAVVSLSWIRLKRKFFLLTYGKRHHRFGGVSVFQKTMFFDRLQRSLKAPRQTTRPRSVCGYSSGASCAVRQNALLYKDFSAFLKTKIEIYAGVLRNSATPVLNISFCRLATFLTLWDTTGWVVSLVFLTSKKLTKKSLL